VTTADTIFRLVAVAILAGFCAVFFGKMASQRRRGMRTSLLRRGDKPRGVFATELTLKAFVFATYTAQVVSICMGTHADCLPLRVAGAVVAAAGLGLFAAAVRTMADSWRTEIPEGERPRLVVHGVFRVSRNPAFLGFDAMFAGMAAMFFNPALLVLTLGSIAMYHAQILREERYLTATLGAEYTAYAARVRRYLGTKIDK
jgi:protein-S-isoprenylcysteine O-methyltransferase Ste14